MNIVMYLTQYELYIIFCAKLAQNYARASIAQRKRQLTANELLPTCQKSQLALLSAVALLTRSLGLRDAHLYSREYRIFYCSVF